MGLLIYVIVLFLRLPYATLADSRSVIDLKGSLESVIWVVQLSDLHFSVYHPDRAIDFKRLVGPALAMIKPSLVFITGDLTDGKSKDLLTMKQNEEEWIEYQKVMEDVVERSGLDKNVFYDLRGNHDNFGVPVVGGSSDFFSKYSINGKLRRKNVHSVTVQSGGWKHLFVGFDSTMEIGLRGPTNLFGHPTDQLLSDIDSELSQWTSQSTKRVTKISFGHFPLSFSAVTESGRSLKDVFLNHSLSAYLCGHLHTRFGKNLKRYHLSDHHFLPPEKYFQLNIHQTHTHNTASFNNCSSGYPAIREFWEWEMGDWRKSRAVRVLAIDTGHVSFVDMDFKEGPKKMIILPTFPLDSRFMLRNSYLHEYSCQSMDPSSYKTVRALVFSARIIVSVVARIYDFRSGYQELVMEATMKKHENSTEGDLYTAPWNWRAFEDPSPDRFWLQIEATNIVGISTLSELRPFSINGLTLKLNWKWKEFLVMGCQWDALYYPILWFILICIFSILLIPKFFLTCFKNPYTYKNFTVGKGLFSGVLWVLSEICTVSFVWYSMLVYMLYLTFFPWFSGNVFTDSGDKGYMTYKGWLVNISDVRRKYMAFPDVMVVVLPHLYFVVLPSILVTGALAAEREAYRIRFLALSGKKEDDYDTGSKGSVKLESTMCCGARWMRKLLMVVCFVICWKHWKECRAMIKAYGMNPLIDSPGYCLTIPLLLAYDVFKTKGIQLK